jgi:hypothetical protein
MKKRRRLIKDTAAYNDTFGKDTLIGVELPRPKLLPDSVHHGKFAICMDFAAWFDQFPLSEAEKPFHGFQHEGQWYRLCRLPMGQRQSVDVAHTATELIMAFALPAGVRTDVYIDNVRFLGDDPEAVKAAARQFVQRARTVRATINEVSAEDDVEAKLAELLHQRGEFLGVEFDYVSKRVRVGAKAAAKLSLMRSVFREADTVTHRHFMSIFGLLFYALQVTRAPAYHRYYALREYSDVARRLQADPGLLEAQYRCPPARYSIIMEWVDEVDRNAWWGVRLRHDPTQPRFALVTDASGWGWGAILLDTVNLDVLHAAQRWHHDWSGRRKSSWSEAEGIARALGHFFPTGTSESITILSDSSAAVGAYNKGRSSQYAMNRAVTAARQACPNAAATAVHIPGERNPADPLSRGKQLGTGAQATQEVLRLLMGLPRDGGPREEISSDEEDG